MKYDKKVFDILKNKIGSEQGLYSAVRRKERKFRAAKPEELFYLIAAEKGIKISKYIKDEILLNKVDELMKRDEDQDNRVQKPKHKIFIQKVKVGNPYNYPLSKFNIDEELIKDCKIVKPYRSCIREALLTLETKIKQKLKVSKNGKALIQECKVRGVFKREEPSEEEGLLFLFLGSILWLRNPPSHNKINYEKEDAIKIILFTDHLIKLFYDLCKKNNI